MAMAIREIRCRGTLVVVSILGVALAVGLAVSVAMHFKEKEGSIFKSKPPPQQQGQGDDDEGGQEQETTETIRRTCRVTLYPDVCVKDLMSFPGAAAAGDARQLVPMSINATRQRVVDTHEFFFQQLIIGAAAAADNNNTRAASAYRDCMDLLDAAADLLQRSSASCSAGAADASDDDVATWLSAALTYHDTCNDSLHELRGDDAIKLQTMVEYLSNSNLSEHLSNSLAIFASNRRTTTGSSSQDETAARRSAAACPDYEMVVPDMVVAQDGTGTHLKIGDAINAAPINSPRRFVIHVKAGIYSEDNIVIARNKANLMLVGDGVNKTILVGHRNVVDDNVTTFRTATLAVAGDGFLMRDMTVENRAGPEKAQAVALLVTADRAVIYRCAILGYQDTLYAHVQRQFYRDCDIAGTVDFVVGNAAVVLQNCTLWARRPMPRQKITVTAQGRRHADQNTGISVHRCRLLPSPELVTAKKPITYLGRPWRPYARVVYMMSSMADHVSASGWLPWDASSNGVLPDTVYYGEYQNSGPGASLTGRVGWPGHHVITRPDEATEFTVARFIAGSTWLPPTKVPFDAGLLLTE